MACFIDLPSLMALSVTDAVERVAWEDHKRITLI